MNTLIKFIHSMVFLALTACHVNVKVESENQSSQLSPNPATEFLAAYNQADKQAMLAMVHPEIRYMFIDGNKVYTETKNKKALGDFLDEYFKANPDAQSELISSYQSGSFIHQVEKALWQDKNGLPKSQCSLSVYELEAGLIVNIWYFTAYPC